TCAIPRRMFEAGISRSVRSMRTALRIRVSISAIGSVIMANGPSTTAAGNAPAGDESPDDPGRGGRGVGAAGGHCNKGMNSLPSSGGPTPGAHRLTSHHGRRPAAHEADRAGAVLPARLLHAGDQPAAGQVPEANPADSELAVEAAGTPAEAASVA